MGLLASLKATLGGAGKDARPVAFEPGEVEVGRVVACTLKGGKPWFGGDLVLTDRRLIFTPLEVRYVAELLQYGLKKADAPGGAVAVVGWMARQGQQVPTDLGALTSVVTGRQASLLEPPSLVVTTSDGRTLEFGVLASRRSGNISGANKEARDQFVALVNSKLS